MPNTIERKKQGREQRVLGQRKGGSDRRGFVICWLGGGCSKKVMFHNGLKEVKLSVWSHPEAQTVLSSLFTLDYMLLSCFLPPCALYQHFLPRPGDSSLFTRHWGHTVEKTDRTHASVGLSGWKRKQGSGYPQCEGCCLRRFQDAGAAQSRALACLKGLTVGRRPRWEPGPKLAFSSFPGVSPCLLPLLSFSNVSFISSSFPSRVSCFRHHD